MLKSDLALRQWQDKYAFKELWENHNLHQDSQGFFQLGKVSVKDNFSSERTNFYQIFIIQQMWYEKLSLSLT